MCLCLCFCAIYQILDTFIFKIIYHITCYVIFKIIKIAFKMSLIRNSINLLKTLVNSLTVPDILKCIKMAFDFIILLLTVLLS